MLRDSSEFGCHWLGKCSSSCRTRLHWRSQRHPTCRLHGRSQCHLIRKSRRHQALAEPMVQHAARCVTLLTPSTSTSGKSSYDNQRPRRPPEFSPPRLALAELAELRAAEARADDIALGVDWRATLELRPAEVAEKRLGPLLPDDRAEGDGGAGRGAAERALLPGADPNARIDDPRDSTAERGEDDRMGARAAAAGAL